MGAANYSTIRKNNDITPSSSKCKTVSLSVSSSNASAAKPNNRPTRRRILQNFLLIFLDSNMDESANHYRHSITELEHIVYAINVFTNIDECLAFIIQVKDENIFMIVSPILGQQILHRIHHLSQLRSVYIFCQNEIINDEWTKTWPKVKGTFTDIISICQILQQATYYCDQDSISMSLISRMNTSNQDLNQLDQSFMYTQLLKEILFEIEYDKQNITDFMKYFRYQFIDNQMSMNIIEEFEKKYYIQSPIWWYTRGCFIHSMLNRALRTQDIDTIINMGFFIKALHQHIKQLYSEQALNRLQNSFTVYRGQGMSKSDFKKLTNTMGGLMSFNNFLSTSRDRDVSVAFAESNKANADSMGILFRITVDTSISSTPFAFLDHVSYYKENEDEVLFSMHTIFRIGEIKPIDDHNRIWQVELTLTNDKDQQLMALTDHMRAETFDESKGWHRLGMLLIKLGEFEKAEQMYSMPCDTEFNDIYAANLYHQLGYIKYNLGDCMTAISFYEKSLRIRQTIFHQSHPALAISYNSIGLVFNRIGNYSEALQSHNKSLGIRQKTLSSNHIDLAESYNNLGSVFKNVTDYPKALSFYEKSLEIYQRNLPINHPDLATLYCNIGSVYSCMSECPKALSSQIKALEIRQKILPLNHPDLATSYCNIGSVYDSMGEYSTALSYYQKSLEMRRKILSLNHSDLATSYDNIGSAYRAMNDYEHALLFCLKALEIRQQTLDIIHPDLALSYTNIAMVYHSLDEYKEALTFYEKALDIRQRILPKVHLDLAILYSKISKLYYQMGRYEEALVRYLRLIEINESILPEDHPDIAISYDNIGLIYRTTGKHSKADSFFEKASRIRKKKLCQIRTISDRDYSTRQLKIITVFRRIVKAFQAF